MNNARRKQVNALLATLKAVRGTLADIQSAELLAARNADAEGPADSLSLAEQSLDETLNHLEDALRFALQRHHPRLTLNTSQT